MYLNSKNRVECVGCQSCVDICPKQCIKMMEDEEGFKYPVVDENKCVSCHLCEKVCPVSFEDFHLKKEETAWAGLHKSSETCFNSSSGGAFTAIYETLIAKGYSVYGVKWGDDFKVIHDRADTEEECEQFRKSKYVLSDTNHCFTKIEMQLRAGEKVLFSGTPCQCAALQQYLGVKRVDKGNLFVVDIVCHGAPNQKVFDKYIGEFDADPKLYEFRFKNKIPYCGVVNSRSGQLLYADGTTRIIHAKNDPFMRGYYGRLFYRPSCAECKFARIERCTDLTIADAWHIEKIHPEYDSLSGVSLLLVNSSKGRKVFSLISDKMDLIPVDIDWAEQANAQLNKPTEMHKGREKFFKLMATKEFSKAVSQAMDDPMWKKCARKVKRLILNRGGVIPDQIYRACPYTECSLNRAGYCTVLK